MNRTDLIGFLGAKPELRFTSTGQPVASLRLATNESFTNKSGERVQRTEWHRIVVWGKMAEHCEKYLDKGRQVRVTGKLQTRQWEDKEGHKRYTTEVVAREVEFLGSGQRNQKQQQDAKPSEETKPDLDGETQQGDLLMAGLGDAV